ncbi:hypothetical protein ACFE04_002389 [Oxalis oulophora]
MESSSNTMNLKTNKQSQTRASSKSTRSIQFGLAAHEVPSGPNPISNRQQPVAPQARPGSSFRQQSVAPQPRPEIKKTVAPAHPQSINKNRQENKEGGNRNIAAETFTFRELAAATRNFRQQCLIGEGGFGRVYKGKLDKVNQVVAVKQLDRNGLQGNREFLVEKPLDWYTRMKVALGAAKGLEYLHDKANPPVIYRDMKSSNILLDNEFNAKLSDFGLAKLGPIGDKTHVSSRVMGTYGYCAPEYQRTGQLTVKSDVYSFGVVLLELITGRRAIDTTRPPREQNLVTWAEPLFKEQSSFPKLVDPLLVGDFPTRGLNQAVAVAAMCLTEDAHVRPLISDVVSALSFLGSDPGSLPLPFPSPPRSDQNETPTREDDYQENIINEP